MESKFTRLLTTYPDAIPHRRRFAALVMDFFPGFPMEQRLLCALYDLGLPREIAAAKQVGEDLAREYRERLEKDYGVSREKAAWAVAVWCLCYGRDALGKPCAVTLPEPEQPPTPQKKKAPSPRPKSPPKKKPAPQPVSPFDLLSPPRNLPPKRKTPPSPPAPPRPVPRRAPPPPVKSGGTYNDRFSFAPAESGLWITGFSGETETLTIPDRLEGQPVTGVAPGAFAGAGMVQVVAVGPLALIGAGAFRDCSRLGQFILSSGLEEIGGSAFENCGALKGVSFPPGLRCIGDRAFAGAAISWAVLPASLTGLGEGAFQGCKALGEVVLPPSLRRIPPRAFAGCGALEKIALPHGLTAIGGKAFAGCSHLAVLDIPATVEEIAPDAFEGRGADFWIFCRMGSAAERHAREQRIPFQITE